MSAGAEDEVGDGGKAPAEPLVLRARPRPIARFRRWLLIGGIGLGAASLSVLVWVALSASPALPNAREPQPTLAATGGEETLSMLPKDYAQSGAPKLGPPLPGDLGRAIVDQQGRGETPTTPSRTLTPAQQAAEQARGRLAAEALEARASGLLIQTSARGEPPVQALELAGGPAAPMAEANTATTTTARQAGKLGFLEGQGAGVVRNAHDLAPPTSPYEVMAGDVISAALVTGLDSDLPGVVIAQVTQNVYDTVTGRFLLIPQGARLIGSYDSVVAFGQKRALVVWRRLVLPDGWSMPLDNLPASDIRGYAGLRDRVDFHTWRLLQGVGMSTLLGIGSELSLDDDGDLVRALQRSTQQSISQAGQQIVSRRLDVQPTLRVRPGWPLKVIVHKDLVLRPWRPS